MTDTKGERKKESGQFATAATSAVKITSITKTSQNDSQHAKTVEPLENGWVKNSTKNDETKW